MDGQFTNLIKEHFGFLIDEFGFRVANQASNKAMYGDRLVEFRSETTHVTVTSEGVLVVILGSVSDSNLPNHYLMNVVECFDPKLAKIVKAAIGPTIRPRLSMQAQAIVSTALLRLYCVPILRGDFSQWNAIGKHIVLAANEIYRAQFGKELGETALSYYLKTKGVTL